MLGTGRFSSDGVCLALVSGAGVGVGVGIGAGVGTGFVFSVLVATVCFFKVEVSFLEVVVAVSILFFATSTFLSSMFTKIGEMFSLGEVEEA